jgi:hypothetical protein
MVLPSFYDIHHFYRWRLVIHGGIDGYSRLPVFLNVGNNNRAETVLRAFLGAVQLFGLPKRVRSDKGGENVLVAQYMVEHQSSINRPFIAGRSVHNQRFVISVLYNSNLIYQCLKSTHYDSNVLKICK